MSRLTDEQVRELRRLAASGVRPSDLAARFDISRSAVTQIVARRLHGAGTVAVTVSPGDLHLLQHLAAEEGRELADVAGRFLAEALRGRGRPGP